MMEEDRMCGAGVRPPKDDEVRGFDLLIRGCAATRSENSRQTGDRRSVSGSIAAIDVVVVENRSGELLGHEVHLVRCLGTGEHP
jgi:hypothetical protein